MRLERLEVGGFGRLRDVDVDFHPRITVLLGENESGKSTVQRAIRAALYGLDAGGPGRPTERSDWARWTPWSAGPYSLVLTYELDDGRRLRVARRLEQRDHTCQVHEIGGGDVTSEARVGRAVAPGQVHLGIDDAVFCASACVGEEGLRLGAADAPAARAGEVQEAIERLADSGEQTTAAQAISAIREAMTRVGSERRLSSPLGRAVNRLRQLEVQIDDARRRLRSLASEEERLRALEADSERADHRRVDAERRWLLGRLAAIAAQRVELASTEAELALVAADVEGMAAFAGFPLDAEDLVSTVAAELQEARRAADDARARAEAAAPQLADVRRRRAEIGAGLRALARSPEVGPGSGAEAEMLERSFVEHMAGRRRADDLAAAGRRRDALRREIAQTGVAGTTAAGVEAAIELVEVARGRRSSRVGRVAATIALLGGAGAAAVFGAAHVALAALLAGGIALMAALVILAIDRLLGGETEQARRRLATLCPGVALDGEGLDRLAERLPRLRALHAELQREEVRVETLAAEVDEADAGLRLLATEASALAASLGLDDTGLTRGRSAEETVRIVLDAISGAAGIAQRREELHVEDTGLAQREQDLGRLATEADDRNRAAESARSRLRRVLDSAGVDPTLAPHDAVTAFRAGCAGRRRHDEAARRLTELSRHRSRSADAASLERLRADLEARLVARGGDPAEVGSTEPLDHGRLQDLEQEVEHARKGSVAASSAAGSLRARLAGLRAGGDSLADLEDERAACVAARDRAVHQLAALQRAAELIDRATRSIHRDLAPRLASSVGERLALLTDGRYTAVNVDTAHFAVSLASRDRPDLVPLELVSHGTRDQVSLLLRLALAEVLSGAGEGVPLLLDEPLLSSDPQRRATALRFLWNLSETNQLVLSTSDPMLVDELQDACDGERPAVLALESPAMTIEARGRPVVVARAL